MRQPNSLWVALAVLAAPLAAAAPAPAQPAPPPPPEAPEAWTIYVQDELQARGWLGIAFAVEAVAGGGLKVAAVHPRSPAASAGLAVDDVVMQINGAPLDGAALRALRLQPGDTARLRVRREGQRDRNLTLVAVERPRQVASVYRTTPGEVIVYGAGPEGRTYIRVPLDSLRVRFDTLALHADSLHRRVRVILADSLGPQLRRLERDVQGSARLRALADTLATNGRAMALSIGSELGARGVAGAELAELTPQLAEYFRGAQNGVVVLRVAPNTPAARAGLEPGDVVTRVDGTEVRTVRALRSAVAGARDGEVALDVVRRGQAQRLALRWRR